MKQPLRVSCPENGAPRRSCLKIGPSPVRDPLPESMSAYLTVAVSKMTAELTVGFTAPQFDSLQSEDDAFHAI